MDLPLVSIIIPVWNRENLIGETLDSVLSQTYQNWECIIVDDGSTDGTVEVIKLYCGKDLRYKFLNRDREPKGAPTCRNIGLISALGDYIIFLDSDDLLFSWALKERINFLDNNPGIDFCVSQGIHGIVPINPCFDYTYTLKKEKTNVYANFIMLAPVWITPNPTWKKHCLVSNNITWNENLNALQDVEFHTIAILKKLKFKYQTDSLDNHVRSHNFSRITENTNINLEIITLLNDRIPEYISKKNKNELKILIAKIITDYYLNETDKCKSSCFLKTSFLSIPDYIKLYITLPIIRFLRFRKIKGRSYLIDLIIRIFRIKVYFNYKYENISDYFPRKINHSDILELCKLINSRKTLLYTI